MYSTFRKLGESVFAGLYLWMAKAKLTMGIFYLVFTLVYLFFGFFTGKYVAVDFFTALEMMFACFFIGIAQQAIIPQNNITKTRAVLWIITGTVITVLFSLVFDWFAVFPVWCFAGFLLILFMGMCAVILSYIIGLREETKILNRQLELFQSKGFTKE